jgi:H+/Na+-translocating ferredoxin:NAD+ oxidoreductase subunit G
MSAFKDHILRVGLTLAAFAIAATSLVVLTEDTTHDKIIDEDRKTLLKAINAVITNDQYDNEILTDTLILGSNKNLGTKKVSTVYRARKNGKPVAAVLTTIAPNGYNGKIKLLVGIAFDGSLTGVRVIQHKETPGLGDKIDIKKADWILNFTGRSLSNPDESLWKVKKDGGDFDQFTGATITPRAVVGAVKKSLLYFNTHRDALFVQSETKQ